MRLLIRTDGDHRIGSGHVMRMLALAEHASADGMDVRFLCARLDDRLAARIESAGFEVIRNDVTPGSPADAAWVVDQPGDWVVVDGYAFEAAFQSAIHAAGRKQMVIDDYAHCDHYVAELVLNANIYASEEIYPKRAPHTKLLLGTKYVLLRREFERQTKSKRIPDHILVTLGGADPVNATEWVVGALGQLARPFTAAVLVGPANPNLARIELVGADPRITIAGATDDIAALMQSASIAIAGAGVTTYELCFMGVPSMLTVLADNQVAVAAAAASAGAAVDLGWHRALDERTLAARIDALLADGRRRDAMEAAALALVDGRGAQRTLQMMRDG